jgi:hypothetical protein
MGTIFSATGSVGSVHPGADVVIFQNIFGGKKLAFCLQMRLVYSENPDPCTDFQEKREHFRTKLGKNGRKQRS